MSGTTRRNLILLSGLTAVSGGWQWWVHRPRPLEFEPIAGLPDWRRFETGKVTLSAAGAVFIGLDDRPEPMPPEALCPFLYPSTDDRLPAAIFTDINCPNCASLQAKLASRRDRLNLGFIDLPLLGPFSEAAARVSIAAELLSGMPSEPPRALRGRGIAPVVQYYAARSSLDGEILNDFMDSPEVKARLAQNRSAAETLGILGTPALTLGRTLVMGDVAAEPLDRIIAMEVDGTSACT